MKTFTIVFILKELNPIIYIRSRSFEGLYSINSEYCFDIIKGVTNILQLAWNNSHKSAACVAQWLERRAQ
jgi:hypothetical protein